ncbi:putative helicase/DNA methylase domain protein [Helicobacter pylori Hp A-16]|uniref:hypothetical protein n=1 Tax=Helicobacter pylori TaxID=210 RepID=UPI00026AD2EE|nr:putative helicase/DNA methylase domain protein [Helicobacter pylori Hp A-16]
MSLEALDNAHEIENKNPLDEAQELLESLSSYDENGNLIAPSKKELENELKEKEAKNEWSQFYDELIGYLGGKK